MDWPQGQGKAWCRCSVPSWSLSRFQATATSRILASSLVVLVAGSSLVDLALRLSCALPLLACGTGSAGGNPAGFGWFNSVLWERISWNKLKQIETWLAEQGLYLFLILVYTPPFPHMGEYSGFRSSNPIITRQSNTRYSFSIRNS
jgi:hypothetical protein